MARGQRKDVDYFPHECNHGRKMNIIETRYGNDGYALWFKLLEQLGKANNHYISIADDMNLMFLSSVFRLTDEHTFTILSDLAKLGAIDKFLFEKHKVIYSQKFIDSIQDAYRKRNSSCITYTEILEELGVKNIISSGSYTYTDANLPEETPNPAEVILKEKNSKVKERKEKESIVDRKLKFAHTLEPFLEQYGRDFLNDFYSYWTEENDSKTKFRREMEKTWSLERRLSTWAKNEKNFKKEKSSAQKEKEPAVIGRQTAETAQNNFKKFLGDG